MRKWLIGLAVATVVVLPAVAIATPPTGGPPGQGDCSHGNSGQTCVPDPQPTNGQDCEEHGQQGGVNEDHCLTTTIATTTSPPLPTTTVTEVPTTTTTVSETTPPPTETETTTVSSVPPGTPSTFSTTPTETTTSTTTTAVPSNSSQPPTTGGGEKEQPRKLAFTGVEDVVPLAAGALALATLGSGMLWFSRKRDAE